MWIALAFAISAVSMAPPTLARTDPAPCDMLPAQVRETAIYAGHSERWMCEAGLPALWQGVPGGAAVVTRFTFTSGHSLFWRSVSITELPDGTGRLEVVGGGFERRNIRSPWRDLRPLRRKLSAKDIARLRHLAEEAGAFEHEVGTWDRLDDERSIFLHCQLLEMERADRAGYRFSSVNIGCNRPKRLMPLVDAVIAFGRVEMVRRNWAGYP